MLIGEPGIGKTTLASAIADRARDLGAAVLWGRCSGLEVHVAWAPISQALGALLDEGAIDATIATACGGGLLAILPEAARLNESLVAPAGADSETIGFAVTRATVRLLRQVCLARPCVLVIDDVHDADAATLRLLARLAQEARTMSLLVAMTAREGELATSKHAIEIGELAREATSMRIGALDDDAAAELVRGVAPRLPGELVERVRSAGEGNPLYLHELAALLASRRDAGPAATLPIPIGVKASIRSRLDRLPDDTKAFVGALAVLGGETTLERAAEIAGVPPGAAMLAIELGIIVAEGARARLLHALVREVAYAEMPAAARLAAHRRAADRVSDAGERVRHLAACGDTSAAIDSALEMARVAVLRAVDEEAVTILEVAQTAAAAGSVDDRRRATLAIALGRARLRAGSSEAGIAACAEGAAIGERIGDPDLVAASAVARGSVFRFGHVDRGLVAALRGAIAVRGAREDALHARLLARLAAAEQPSLDPWKPIAMAHEAFAIARRLGDDNELMMVLHDGGSALVDIEDPRIRVEVDSQLREVAHRNRAPWYELRALHRLVFDHADLGAGRDIDTTIADLDGIARSFAHPRHQWRVALVRAARAASQGQWSAADRYAEEAIAFGGDEPMQELSIFSNRYARLRTQERSQDVLALLDDERDLTSPVAEAAHVWAPFQAAAYARTGKHEQARRALAIGERALTFEDTALNSMYAEAAVALGDREACARVEPWLASQVHRFVHGGPLFAHMQDPIERYLGLVANALGDRARAIKHLDSALEKSRAAGLRPYVARTALELGQLLTSGTDAERARGTQLVREARAIAEELDLVDLRPRADEAPLEVGSGLSLVPEGDTWAIIWRGTTFHAKDSRGLRILAKLVQHEGEELHVLDLIEGGESGTVDRGDAGEMLDARARAEYRARLVELREDLEEAEGRGDLGWMDRLRTEAEAIEAELSRAFSKSGRARRAGVASERARSAVTRRLRETIGRLAELDADLGTHLSAAIRTGVICSYRGKPG
jgi:hypothetical protein